MKAQSDCVYTDFKYFAYTKGGGGGGGGRSPPARRTSSLFKLQQSHILPFKDLFYAVKEVSKAHQGCIWSMNFNYKK